MSDELITAEVREMAARAYKRVSWSDPDEKAMHAALAAVLPALIEKARDEEREACAVEALSWVIKDDQERSFAPHEWQEIKAENRTLARVARLIRARTQPETQEPTP